MTKLFELKEKLKNFYGTYEFVLRPILKFMAVFCSLILIKFNIEATGFISSWIIVLALSVICAFIPWGLITVLLAADIVINVFTISTELGALMLIVMLIMYLFFFRFCPSQGMILILVPLAFFRHIPYVMPIVVGLVCAPTAIVSVVLGTIIYYMLFTISENITVLTQMSGESVSAAGISSIVKMMSGNMEMFLVVVAFVVTTLVVYFIKKMSVDNAWIIAILTGGILDLILILVGNVILKTNVSIVWIIIGTIVSLLVAFIVQFFVFSVDYSRTEHTQFEDGEYYYYVKAVPKINVTAPEMNVKRINAQRRKKVKTKR